MRATRGRTDPGSVPTTGGTGALSRRLSTELKLIDLDDAAVASLPEGAFTDYRSFVERAVDVFGDEVRASRWLSSPSEDLAGRVPLQVARQHGFDRSEVTSIFEPIFIRIEHGIYW